MTGAVTRAARSVWRLRRELVSDTLLLGGAFGVIYGVDLVHRPAAIVLAGLALAFAGWRTAPR